MNYFSIIMSAKKEIPNEVCGDRQENNAVIRWQKQVSSSTGDNPEVATRGNIHIQEKEVMSISCIKIAFIAAQNIQVLFE
jgi:hypothetical protein